MTVLKWLVITTVVGYGGLLALMFVFQRALMYFPDATHTLPAFAGLPQAEEVTLASDDGETQAPATSPATPAINTSFCVAAAAETPTIKLAVERMPSLAPSTAALNHPMRLTKWFSGFGGTRRIRHSARQIKADP